MESGPTASPHASRAVARRFVRWMFLDQRSDRYVAAQWPNVSLWTFIVASALMRLVHRHGYFASTLQTVSVVALVAWALDEIVRGVNPFRRTLGTAVLIVTVVNLAVR